MKLLKNAAQLAMPGNSEQFTGQVWNEVFAVGDAPGFVHVARVIFAPAARAAWHTHPFGQILVAVSGMGLAQKAGEPLIALHPGDSVSIAPSERHWHGAAPDQVFVQLAIQGATPDGQQATWLDLVTDEEYDRLTKQYDRLMK